VTNIELRRGITEIDPAAWNSLSAAGRVDSSHAYLRFRERIEPGEPVLAVLDEGGRPAVGMHGVRTTADAALFSHPWKMLVNEQFLRLGDGCADEVRRSHAGLRRRLVDDRAVDGKPPFAALTAALGEVLVVRGFDTSEVLTRHDLPGGGRVGLISRLLAAVQDLVRTSAAGCIAFPFVRPDDGDLRAALAGCGFRSGVLTGVTAFRLGVFPSYSALIASYSKRRRYRFRSEEQEFRSAGLTMSTARLSDVVERVVELEVANAARHGGTPDVTRLLHARRAMAEYLGDALRTVVVRRGDRIVACGVHLVDRDSYCCLLYGSDHTDANLSTAYQCTTFHEPLRYAVEHGIGRVRLGFEAFVPKLIRGAEFEPRELWIWTASHERLRALAEMLGFLDGRAREYVAGLPAHRSGGRSGHDQG
jgi:hypothetical protein